MVDFRRLGHNCLVYYCICAEEPTPILLGSDWEWVVEHGEQKLTQVKHYGYTIELQEGLQVICAYKVIMSVYVYNCIYYAGTAKKFAVHTTARMEYCEIFVMLALSKHILYLKHTQMLFSLYCSMTTLRWQILLE